MVCTIDDCNKKVVGRGWCSLHWQRWRRYGDPLLVRFPKHGYRYTKTYKTWQAMRERCQKRDGYMGRVAVCERWQNSFTDFLSDMGERPDGMTLDRIDNGKGYSKDNCRWATHKQQNHNRRNNVLVTLNGETKVLAEWCRLFGKPTTTVFRKYHKGVPLEDIFGVVQ